LENEEKITKKGNLFKDLFMLEEAIKVLHRRRGIFFNSGERCQELLDEQSKILQELVDILEKEQPKKGEKE